MNQRDLARYRKRIEDEKRRVHDQLGRIEEGVKARASVGDNNAYSNHMADVGSDAIETEQTFMYASKGSEYLRALDDALVRIDRGTYGTCEVCGAAIPARRLGAYLAARYCVPCKGKLEKRRG